MHLVQFFILTRHFFLETTPMFASQCLQGYGGYYDNYNTRYNDGKRPLACVNLILKKVSILTHCFLKAGGTTATAGKAGMMGLIPTTDTMPTADTPAGM